MFLKKNYSVIKYQHVRSRGNFLVSVIKSRAEMHHNCGISWNKCARKEPVESQKSLGNKREKKKRLECLGVYFLKLTSPLLTDISFFLSFFFNHITE